MPLLKKTKDQLIKLFFGDTVVPRGLYELDQYFRLYGPISFLYEKSDGVTVARSENYRYGAIVTSGRNENELDKNIKDAILTSFEVPSSFSKEAKIYKTGEQKEEYALA